MGVADMRKRTHQTGDSCWPWITSLLWVKIQRNADVVSYVLCATFSQHYALSCTSYSQELNMNHEKLKLLSVVGELGNKRYLAGDYNVAPIGGQST